MNQEDCDELESLVDKNGLSGTLQALAQICSEKADHIRSSYDDDETADLWEEVADDLNDIDAGDA
jgi:hypothetical protein